MVIVSPALAAANNGNWQTARRWRRLLAGHHRVRIASAWPDGDADGDQVLLALHARRSAASIEAWSRARGPRGLGVVLTGTDLYVDLGRDPVVERSLHAAGRIVVLQPAATDALPAALRDRTQVVLQSCPALPPLPRTAQRLQLAVVGHMREVKRPDLVFTAARLVRDDPAIAWRHAGEADARWAALARAAEAEAPGYRWCGPLAHAAARQLIRESHLLVHPSDAEGGAHVVMEAVRSGTPVLASQVPGNVGMLGADYAGYFPQGDAPALAALVARLRAEQAQGVADGLLGRLQAQCEARAPLFDAAAERTALLRLVQHLQDCP